MYIFDHILQYSFNAHSDTLRKPTLMRSNDLDQIAPFRQSDNSAFVCGQ